MPDAALSVARIRDRWNNTGTVPTPDEAVEHVGFLLGHIDDLTAARDRAEAEVAELRRDLAWSRTSSGPRLTGL